MATSTSNGATKQTANTAASGRTSLRSLPCTGRRPIASQLDLAIEPFDQCAALGIELFPVEGTNLGKIGMTLGDRARDCALERHFAVGWNDIVGRLRHCTL